MLSLLLYGHAVYASRGDQPAASELSAPESHPSFYVLRMSLALVKTSELRSLHCPSPVSLKGTTPAGTLLTAATAVGLNRFRAPQALVSEPQNCTAPGVMLDPAGFCILALRRQDDTQVPQIVE